VAERSRSQTEVRKPDTGVAGLRAAEPAGRYPGAGRPYLARGLTKSRAELGEWCQQVAVSTPLRKCYDHDPEPFEEFSRRYRAELEDPDRAKALQHRCST
jgi:hypothetical protein